MGGFLVYSNGQFKLVPAIYQSPTVTLNESHLRSPIQLNTRISKRELFNAVKGVYAEPANDYQPQNYPFLTNSTFESEDNSERIYASFDYPFTTSSRTSIVVFYLIIIIIIIIVIYSSSSSSNFFKLI